MKNFFIAISVLVAMTFCMVPAQANMGIPDDVPGTDAVLPFIVGMTAPAINTLVVFTDVRGYSTLPLTGPQGWNFHYTVNTIKSVTIWNDNLGGTDYDIVSTDAWSIIKVIPSATLSSLEVDLDGDGVNDHWAGYIYFDQTRPNRNQMIGQTIFANIQQGQYAAANTWFKERSTLGAPFTIGGIEVWTANALASAESRVLGGANVAATAFGLYPRFFIYDANTGQDCLIIWKNQNWVAATDPFQLPTVHITLYDEDEHPYSTNIPLPYELNIICLEPTWLPDVWAGYPKEGWLRIELPDINGNGFSGVTEWAGYNWTTATGGASESWSSLTQIHRDVRWTGQDGNSWDNFLITPVP